MYESTGAGSVLAGTTALILPDTSGNSLVTILAFIAIGVGVAILLTSLLRSIVKRSAKA